MRKKLAATVCVFAGVIISASLLIVSVLAATSAKATITASISYTPAIQAKVWLHDGGTYTNGTGSDAEKGMLIFDNTNTPSDLYTGVTCSGGTISFDDYSAVNGTTFTITVENHSTGVETSGNTIHLGLKVGGESTAELDNTETPAVTLKNEKYVETTFITTVSKFESGTYKDYRYLNTPIAVDATGSITFTPEIAVPGTLNFDILLFDTP